MGDGYGDCVNQFGGPKWWNVIFNRQLFLYEIYAGLNHTTIHDLVDEDAGYPTNLRILNGETANGKIR